MKNSITSLLLLCCALSRAQSSGISNQSIQVQGGTTIFYNQLSLRYESQTIYSLNENHHFKIAASAGLFNLSFSSTTKGYLFTLQPTYLLGDGKHHLEVSFGAAIYYHTKLEKGGISYLGALPCGFVGYRYQNPENRFLLKIGTGGLDILQAGFGIRL